MNEFITDDQLCDALNMASKEYYQIVDFLRLKKYNTTGIVKVIKTDAIKQIPNRFGSIYSPDYNNNGRTIVWAWNVDVAEEIAQKILDFKQIC